MHSYNKTNRKWAVHILMQLHYYLNQAAELKENFSQKQIQAHTIFKAASNFWIFNKNEENHFWNLLIDSVLILHWWSDHVQKWMNATSEQS